MKILVTFSNVYDCEPAIEAVKKLPCDVLFLDYFPYPENYLEIEKFLKNEIGYTHLLYVAPDLVIPLEVFKSMVEYMEINDPLVYGCCLNVDNKENIDSLAACLKLPEIEYNKRRYRWIKENHRLIMLQSINVIPVKFNGGFHFIKREIKDKILYTTLPFITKELPIWETRGGYACDLALSHWLDFLDIPILLDLRYKIQHLRFHGDLLVGKKEPKITFYKYNG
jgi:hypothetical protein